MGTTPRKERLCPPPEDRPSEGLSSGGEGLNPLEGVPDLPVAPQDEAGLTKTFQTWPRGWFHIPEDPDFPVPS